MANRHARHHGPDDHAARFEVEVDVEAKRGPL